MISRLGTGKSLTFFLQFSHLQSVTVLQYCTWSPGYTYLGTHPTLGSNATEEPFMIVQGSFCTFTIPWNQSHPSSRLQPVRNYFCPSKMSGSIKNYLSESGGSRPFEKPFLFIFRDASPVHLGPSAYPSLGFWPIWKHF